MRSGIERAVEMALVAGLLASTGLLLAGLLLASESLVRVGMLLLMATPVARVVVVTLGLLRERDWLFASVSLFVLGVLAGGFLLSLRP